MTETPMCKRAANNEVIQRCINRKQPLDGGRIRQPSELDAAAVYFMSGSLRFTTGQVLGVDGVWCVREGQIAQDTD